MDAYKKLENLFKPTICKQCGGAYIYMSMGVFECENCGNIIMDDFGKIRTFLEEHPKASMGIVSEQTGIPTGRIEKYLREGRLQIPESSNVFIKCENCRTDIRYGRYCPVCAAEMSKKLDGVLKAYEIGEIPKAKSAKMHYLGNDDNKWPSRR